MRPAISATALVAAVLTSMVAAGAARTPASEPARFRAVDVWIDSSAPVAAWQIDLHAVAGDSMVVGVEGGEAPFTEPAYYDPRALSGGHIVLASFTTGEPLAAGRHRVARVHLRESGAAADYTALLVVAAGADGEAVAAAVTTSGGDR